ncbi:MAG: hypothetical protein IRZ08_13050, partial [Frankia sp.]|nr:hypothetical protein [Frankia sp.]
MSATPASSAPMSVTRRALTSLSGVVLAGGLAAALVWAGPRLTDLPSGPSDVPDWFADGPEQALATVVGAAAWICLLWLCAGVILGSLAAVPGALGRVSGRIATRMLPQALRRALEVGLGITLVTAGVVGTAGGALAAPAAAPASATGSDWPVLIPPTSQRAPDAWPDLTPPVSRSTSPSWPDLTPPDSSRAQPDPAPAPQPPPAPAPAPAPA